MKPNLHHVTHSRFTIHSEEDLLEAFREKDQDKILFPDHVPFPINVDYYYSWTEPSGAYTYLIFKRPNWELPRGLVFRRSGAYVITSNMCDWCHSYGSSEEIGMLNIKVNDKVSVGQYLCLDLDCLEKIETQIGQSGKNFETLAEQLCQKIARFYERVIMAPKN